MITPKTNKVYAIWGIGTMKNTETAKKEQKVVMAILQEKYGKRDKKGLFDGIYDIERVDQGNRYVVTKVSGYSDVTLDIRYNDSKLSKLAENERILLESKKVDSSGL